MNKNKLMEKTKEPDEKLLFSKALDRASFCMKNYEKAFTDFMNPSSAAAIVDFVKKDTDLNAEVFGGCEGCERVMIGFSKDYDPLEYSDFPIESVKIKYEEKFSRKLSHRDFLGSILGTGIVRGKVGDIVLKEGYAVAFLDKGILPHICTALERVGHTAVKCEKFAIDKNFLLYSNIKPVTFIVSSLRLDAIVAAAFKLSRNEAASLIRGGKIFLNHRCEVNISKNIEENALISARGFGRIKLISAEGMTKKGRTVLKAEKYT